MRYLSPTSLADIREHLADVLSGAPLEDALVMLDEACWHAQLSLRHFPTRLERNRRAHQHFSTMAASAAGLITALAAEPPVFGTADVDWPAFNRMLETVRASAMAEAEQTAPRRSRGRTPLDWRDGVIAAAWSIYPEGVATVTAGGHFETLIEILFGILHADWSTWRDRLPEEERQSAAQQSHCDVANIHDTIVDARKRVKQPSIAVEAKRRLRLLKPD